MSSLTFTTPPLPHRSSRKSLRSSSQPRRIHHKSPGMSTATPENPPATPQSNQANLDWRAFRAHLITAHATSSQASHMVSTHHPNLESPTYWAHEIGRLEVGCTLVAKPTHKWPSSFSHLNHSVILITDITDTSILGLIVNRPTKYRVRDHKSVLGRIGVEFSENRVNLGGDCSTGTLEMLHSLPPALCSGSTQIVPGLSRGGFNASRRLVKNKLVAADHFQLFVAYSRWTREQFEAEMEKGAWSIVSCSPKLVLEAGKSDSKAFWGKVQKVCKWATG